MSQEPRTSVDPFDAGPSRPSVPGPATFNESMDGSAQSPPAKSGTGRCLLWGCLLTVVFSVLFLIAGGFGLFWLYNRQLQKFTDTQPAEIPVVEASDEEVEAILGRIEAFQTTVMPEDAETPGDASESESDAEQADTEPVDPSTNADESDSPRELVLTAAELNALISSNEDLRGRLYVDIADGEISGKVSIPTDSLPGGEGRFFNADGRFDVSMQDGVLIVRLTGASVNGEEIPPAVMEGFSGENLAKEFYKDPQNAEVLRRFESIEVLEDSIRLRLRESDDIPTGDGSQTNDEIAASDEDTTGSEGDDD
ncbi:MAG: hypothetical protein AAGC97_05070 [Planctomycetota bacterium]